jgi:hypothetical protein
VTGRWSPRNKPGLKYFRWQRTSPGSHSSAEALQRRVGAQARSELGEGALASHSLPTTEPADGLTRLGGDIHKETGHTELMGCGER